MTTATETGMNVLARELAEEEFRETVNPAVSTWEDLHPVGRDAYVLATRLTLQGPTRP